MKSNNIIFKDVKEFNIIFLILISIFLVGISGYSSYAIFSDEIVSNNEIKGVVKKPIFSGADTIIKKVGQDGLVAESHPATEQLQAVTDYRYTGKNPNNYIKFNNEIWRIIGVFETDDGTGKLEKRIKLINKSGLSDRQWDAGGKNNWTTSTGITELNNASSVLTTETRFMVGEAKWYLGSLDSYNNVSVQQYYSRERGTKVYGEKPTSWVGKVGLMYPSDYGYATNGGSTTNREACLAQAMYYWNDPPYVDCSSNDWLLDSNSDQWLLTPYYDNTHVFHLTKSGYVSFAHLELNLILKPTVYLKADIEISGGAGTEIDPYTIKSSQYSATDGAKTIINKVGTDGLVKEEHPLTEQMLSNTDYRYTGANPNNYIRFNDELWRIIGVFQTDNGVENLDYRIKIVRKESIGNIAWNSNNVSDWTTATGMTLLNSGDYYNKSGSYTLNGLTSAAKNQIDDAKWYLGGTENYYYSSNGLTSHWYSYERGTTEYNSSRPISWVGKIGLMYPSDYGYATSGGTTTNRETCLAKEIYGWNSSSFSDCYNNDWLYNSSNTQWTLSNNSAYTKYLFIVNNTGSISYNNANTTNAVFPCTYLKPNIKITGGNGSSTTPYEISE